MPINPKRDLKRELKHLYHASAKQVVEVEVPAFRFLMIDGEGDPNNTPGYGEAVEALFSVSYITKFSVKRSALALDYAMMPLEGLWWADDWSVFSTGRRDQWKWTMMILQPDFVPEEMIRAAIDHAAKTRNLPALPKLRFERFEEGLAAQIMHIGPFSEEGPTIARIHQHIDAKSAPTGKHHEIYLSDVRRAAPEKWKTIIRQPMRRPAQT